MSRSWGPHLVAYSHTIPFVAQCNTSLDAPLCTESGSEQECFEDHRQKRWCFFMYWTIWTSSIRKKKAVEIHSFSLSNHLSWWLDPKSILGTLDMRREYNLDSYMYMNELKGQNFWGNSKQTLATNRLYIYINKRNLQPISISEIFFCKPC